MKLSLHCPTCSRPIADLHTVTTEVSCSVCRHQFGIVYGKLSKRSSIHETLLFLTAKLPKVYKRHYTLQITTPERTLKQLQFSVPGKTDSVPIHYGDIVSVLYTMHGYVMQKLVAITNHTTGKSYVLPKPIPSASHLTIALGSVMTGLLVASYLSGTNIFLTSVLGASGALAYLKLTHTAQLTTPSLDTDKVRGDRLLADQQLLVQKRKITQRVEELQHDSQSNQVLINQLGTLRKKMAHLDERLYAARITRTASAVSILQQQIENNQRLVREYTRTLKMIEIEVETSWIADQLPEADNFTRKIIQKLEELKAIEEQNQSLKFQLAAYDEVGYGIQRYGE